MMRLLSGALGAVALATVLGSCAAISGLNGYSACTDDCDASLQAASDGAADSGVGPGADAPANDDGGADGELDGGCAEGFLICEAGCLDPSSPSSCGGCDVACGDEAPVCAESDAGSFACATTCPSSSPTTCSGRCVNTSTDGANCGGCGAPCTGTCVNSMCISEGLEAGADGSPGSGTDAAGPCPGGNCPCPASGCPNSTATGFSCPVFGSCNGTSSECTAPGGCFCSNDNQCLSKKCVKVTGENDVSCATNCSGSGGRDGFDCELASPGIPTLASGSSYSCPADSGYKNSTLSCDPTHTNCYCTADAQCTSGKCIPSSNNGNCSGCSGTGTADYRGCEPIATIGNCPIYIGCSSNTTCSYPTCYCTSDSVCDSGHCIPSGHNGNCSGCTGTGTDDGHGCEPAPSSVPCAGTGGTMCTTTLTPAPVPNSAKTACLCVADSNCSSGKCVNADSRCTATCSGSGPADSEGCVTATSVANAWSCSMGNCDNVSSPSGKCTAAGAPCWCTSDSQCPSGAQCASWAGCASGSCTGSGTGNAFHCVP